MRIGLFSYESWVVNSIDYMGYSVEIYRFKIFECDWWNKFQLIRFGQFWRRYQLIGMNIWKQMQWLFKMLKIKHILCVCFSPEYSWECVNRVHEPDECQLWRVKKRNLLWWKTLNPGNNTYDYKLHVPKYLHRVVLEPEYEFTCFL